MPAWMKLLRPGQQSIRLSRAPISLGLSALDLVVLDMTRLAVM